MGRRALLRHLPRLREHLGQALLLRLLNSVWHVRDLGSTNGTTVNGAAADQRAHAIMPDDELGIAGHLFTIDYEPGGPETVLRTSTRSSTRRCSRSRKRHSLMELAGLDTDEDKPKRRAGPRKRPDVHRAALGRRGRFDDALPEHVKEAPAAGRRDQRRRLPQVDRGGRQEARKGDPEPTRAGQRAPGSDGLPDASTAPVGRALMSCARVCRAPARADPGG